MNLTSCGDCTLLVVYTPESMKYFFETFLSALGAPFSVKIKEASQEAKIYYYLNENSIVNLEITISLTL